MECHDAERLMDAWLDHELSAEAAVEMEAHLAECPVCRHRHAGLVQLLNSPEPVIVPSGLRDRVIAAVQAAPMHVSPPAAPQAATRMRPPVRRYWLIGTGAIAASVAIFAMGWLGSIWFRRPAPIANRDMKPKPQETTTVVLSPWVLSTWAQALAMGGPVNPAASAAQAAVMELFTTASFEAAPIVPARPRAATRHAPPDDADAAPPEIPVLPPILRL
jgi:anti-sigma factor RsiW